METKKDVYEIITDQVIKGLETKGLNWFRCWHETGLSVNHITGKPYSGINQFLLAFSIDFYGYTNGEFLTFKQATKLGHKIKRGSKSHMVVFWNVSYYTEIDGKRKYYKNFNDVPSDVDIKKSMTPRYYRVFNVDAIEGLDPKHNSDEIAKGTIFEPRDDANNIYIEMNKKPSLDHGGNKAYYRPSGHHIQMPEQTTFIDSDSYYKVFFHELIHSTGHKDLLNRKTLVDVASFGNVTYSKEELVAEMGSMFLCSILNLTPKDEQSNSQAYINGWIRHLKDHKKEILFASSQSQKAVEYILNVTK